MIAGIVLGMGMPTTPAYIIMTALLVPAIIKLGVIAAGRAHVRVLLRRSCRRSRRRSRSRCLPPPGSPRPISGRAGWAAVKIGAAGFIVPFMFVYEPALLMIGDWPQIIGAFVTASAGILLFAAGLHGYFVTAAALWQRVALVAAGCC